MTVSQCAAVYCIVSTSVEALSAAIASFRCRKRAEPLAPRKDAPPVSIVRPLCGVDPFSQETLASTFALDYPAYEVVFCLASADDPIAPLVRRIMAAHPKIPSRDRKSVV